MEPTLNDLSYVQSIQEILKTLIEVEKMSSS